MKGNDRREAGRTEKVEFIRDGRTIRGHAFGIREGKQSAVIVSHGFLANEKTCRAYAELLAGMGYLAVTFDFCGGGIGSRSDGRSEDMTVMTEKADLQAVMEGVKTQFAPENISLMGLSQGGFVSGLLAADLGAEAVSRLILFYPAVCIPDDARKGKMMFYRFDPAHVPEVLGHIPMKLGGEYARCVMDMDPYMEMQGYAGPVLLVHGTEDSVVHVSYARKLQACYRDCRYVEIEGGAHGFSGRAEEEACSALCAFMQGSEKT